MRVRREDAGAKHHGLDTEADQQDVAKEPHRCRLVPQHGAVARVRRRSWEQCGSSLKAMNSKETNKTYLPCRPEFVVEIPNCTPYSQGYCIRYLALQRMFPVSLLQSQTERLLIGHIAQQGRGVDVAILSADSEKPWSPKANYRKTKYYIYIYIYSVNIFQLYLTNAYVRCCYLQKKKGV